uniref:Tenascin isoform X2 n=1 Tax=Geotrypetes seraphini TaxID=260995 RepID=A0A6P8SDF9_GEOSA|nr:tenascin isoform X2 [Geotrypetes seraphini]
MGLARQVLACLMVVMLYHQADSGIIKKIIRQKREIGLNVTLPEDNQPVIFNHVYNINLPMGSLCSVDLDPTRSGTDLKPQRKQIQHYEEHTMDGENQIVFTHRINIPRRACGCASGSDIKDLLNRLEELEGLVSSLREQCTTGAGCCTGVQTAEGLHDTRPFCNGRGNYSTEACGCICEPGWKGPNCSEVECPGNCNRGQCVNGKCVCEEGFTGEDCSETACPNYCNDQGKCINGICVCFDGYTGEDCSEERCPMPCSKHGKCVNAQCVCNEGFSGEDCSISRCPNNCNNRGRCVEDECICDEGFTGEDCSELICPNDCFDRGRCINGVCECEIGFTGEDCGKELCHNNCNNRGRCVNGQCVCDEGFTGDDCSASQCPNNCNDLGRCVNGKCVCKEGLMGDDCSEQRCPNDCKKKGRCVNGQCVCNEGFTGENCGELSCPNNCKDKGRCVNGQCVCDEGFTGEDCGELSCPNNCKDKGRCVNGQCVCDEGFTGEDCGELSCPSNCKDKGRCVNGQCVCDEGFTGEDCGELSCPSNCKDKGRCVNGQCVCDEGFTGEDCGELSCPNNCKDKGRCVNGQCVCDEGFTGEDCGELSCPNNCKDKGRCVNGQCVCDEGFTGEDCGELSCPNNCKDKGRCVNGQCVCDEGFTGEDCGELSCPSNCKDKGRCVNGQCVCDEGFTGEDCGELSCPNNCKDKGRCVNGQCVCDEGFTGEDCGELSCPNNCNDKGRCVNGQCVCDDGFTGEDCGELSCPNNCNDKGRCVNGQCVCDEGFTGEDCSELSCPSNCKDKGRCVNGQCVCDEGFTGEDCNELSCPSNCNDKGRCVNGQCVCDEGFTGEDCNELSCPSNCNDKGRCVNGQCVCDEGFTGEDCGELSCPSNCKDKGRCVNGQCVCDEGFTGEDCGELSCPNNCNDKGRCVNGQCVCDEGFTGEDCGELSCPSNCNDKGRCVNGQCVCDEGFTGEDCNELSCPSNCNDKGRCVNGQCVCDEGFTGEDCGELSCPSNCNDKGRCVNGQCVCDEGFTGEDCGELSCPSNCNDKGRCVNGQCVCDEGFTGEDCGELSCPNNCKDKGRCVNGQCVCDEGFTGEDCGELSCPNNCKDKGRCVNGQCVCDEGFTGEDCGELSCPNNCKDKGRCVNGQCVCDEGFTGEDCGELSCPSNCKDKGRCVNGQCVCDEGFTGEDCGELSCPNNCKDKGRCVNGQCVCDEGFTGEDCGELSCPNNCNDKGRCVNGQCVCDDGFTGEDCGELSCPNNCNDKGRCVNGQCVCDEGFTGEDCSELSCPSNCKDKGRCVNGQCVCDEGFTGEDCNELSCPSNCNDKGRCVNGQCVCDEGFTGEDCNELSCPSNCNDKGRCVNGQCVCDEGFTGEDCGELSCPSNCKDKGRCVNGQCVCDEGFTGEDCGELSCPNNCNDKGRCVNGQCVCDEGFTGEDCGELSCPSNCNDKGRCVNGQCVCDEGFTGEDCNELSCPSNCNDKGRCVNGQCVCDEGFTGEDCGELSCPSNCNDKGRCVNGQCVCDEGFTGEDCGELSCPSNCNDKGRCVNGQCVCDEGFTGEDCNELSCPSNCNDKGRCVNGQCVCDEGFKGEDCSDLRCPDDCNDQGQCINGQCVCVEGFIGEDCSEVSPPKDLKVTDVTPKTVDLEWENEMEVTEYLVSYVPTAPGGLELDFRVPGNQRNATIRELEPGVEYLIRVFAILKNQKSIPVSARVATHLPTTDDLRFKSIKETWVEVEWEPLKISYDAWKLIFQNTKEENGEIVSTLNKGETTYVQTGLAPGESYQVSIQAVKNNTEGAKLTKVMTTMIDSPSQFEVRDITDTSAILSWIKPLAEVDTTSLVYGDKFVTFYKDEDQYRLGDLKPDTTYNLTLFGQRGDMISEKVTKTITTDLDAPSNLKRVSQTEDNITLEWKNSQAKNEYYRVKHAPIAGGDYVEVIVPRSNEITTNITLTGLRPATEYGIGVTAVKQDRESNPATINAATDLDPPKDLEVTESTGSTLSLRWKKPQSKIDQYRIIYVSSTGKTDEAVISSRITTYVLKGLDENTDYTITIVAEKGKHKSRPVPVKGSTVKRPELYFLHRPTVTPTGFNLSWVATDGAYDSFLLKVTDFLDQLEPQKVNVSGTLRTIYISGLSPGTLYMVRIEGIENGLPIQTASTEAITVSTTTPVMNQLLIQTVGPESFNLFWEMDGLFDSFTISVRDSEGQFDPLAFVVPGDKRSKIITGLKDGTQYDVELYGTLGGQQSEPVLGTVTTVSATTPVMNQLLIHTVGPEGFNLSWEMDGLFDSFTISVRDSEGQFDPLAFVVPGDKHSKIITGLKDGTQYDVELYGTLGGQQSEPVLGTVTTVSATTPVMNQLLIHTVGPEGFNLSWEMDGLFDSFTISVRDSEGQFDPLAFVVPGDKRSKIITGLKDGTQYDVELYGTLGGQQSEPVLGTVTTVSATTPVMNQLLIHTVGPEGFNLSWEMDGLFDSFTISVRDSEGQFDPLAFVVPGDKRSKIITGLKDGTQYDVEIYGTLGGQQSEPVLGTVTTVSATTPVMNQLLIHTVGPEGFNLSWEMDGLFDSFTISVRDSEGQFDPLAFVVPGDKRSKIITGLKDGTQYDVELYGTLGGQQSEPVIGTVTTVSATTPVVKQLLIHTVGPEGFNLSWEADGPFDNFTISVRDSKGQYDPLAFVVPGDKRSKIITGLKDETQYDVELYGTLGRLRLEPIKETVTTALETPKEISFSDITDNSATVSWTALKIPADSFKISYVPVTGGVPATVTVDGTKTQTTLTKLIPGVEYTVSVISVKGLHESEPITGTMTTALDGPSGLMVVNITDAEVLALWQPAIASVDSYVLTYGTENAPEKSETVSGNIVESEIVGLQPATEYTLRMYAVKGPHRSATISTKFTTALDAPKDLSASEIQSETALLTWKPPRSIITGFLLIYESVDGTVKEVVLGPDTTSYRLEDLSPSTHYTVKLQALNKSVKSKAIQTVFTTTGLLYSHPKDCSQALLNGETASGVYTIYLNGNKSEPLDVYCDMSVDGGGWIVFLRRTDGKEDFYRNWKAYSAGFGDPKEEFWMGLENLHKITNQGQYELRVDLSDGSDTAYATYDTFVVGDSKSRYRLKVEGYDGTAGDSMTYHTGRPFSTYDKDHDSAITNCALSYKGAFWYKNCHRVNLMGRYGDKRHSQGINWFHWKGHEYSVESAEMKLRPASFRNLEGRRRRS